MGLSKIDVRPVKSVCLLAIRSFEIDDLDDLWGDAVDRNLPAGFQHHGVAVVEEGVHQGVNLFLFQRLTACDFRKLRGVTCDGLQNLVEGQVLAATVGVLRVAVSTAQGASGKAHEHAGSAHVCRCLLYTSDAADERSSVDLGGRRIIKKKKT